MNYRQSVIRALVCRDAKQNMLDSVDGLMSNVTFLFQTIDRQVPSSGRVDRVYVLKKLCAMRYHIEVLLASIGSTMEEVEQDSATYLKTFHNTTSCVTGDIKGGKDE